VAERSRLTRADLRDAWERNAAGWIEWARAPGHDSYWRFNRDVFLELVPPPGRCTLDLGCGEGRLSRDLKALGHDVVGVDASPTLVAAARESGVEAVEADAAALPFADASFDLVLAFMSLQDVDDVCGAVRETARVLEPGGRFCLAIVHPLGSAGRFIGEEADSPFAIEGSYLDESYYADRVARDGFDFTFVSKHRPLQAYTEALAEAGFVIERLREPPIPDAAYVAERSRRWRRIPIFLYVRARLEPPST
jgi:SAM-dependent methyltransferase